MSATTLACDVCGGNSGGSYVGVACVPGVAMSAAWCDNCLFHYAVPPAVASHWIEDIGLDHLAEWAAESKVWHDGSYITVREYAEVRP
jgi:hypothetical protein